MSGCQLWLAWTPESTSEAESELQNKLLEACLTERDQHRYNRYRPIQKKRQFLNVRLAVREVLRRTLGVDAADTVLETTESGQPIVLDGLGRTRVGVSLSHTEKLAAIVLSDNQYGPGVDIETVQPLNARTFGRSFLSPFEHDWMAKEGLAEDQNALLVVWTLKEALWKSLGGPHNFGFGDIITEYCSKDLAIHFGCNQGDKKAVDVHFFGHRFDTPFELKNYTSIELQNADVSAFVGCMILSHKGLVERS